MKTAADDSQRVPRLLPRSAATASCPSGPGVPAGRPDAALHERGDEPVQGRVPRHRHARLHARGRHAEVHPRLGQAQRPRGGGARHLPPHVLRDARELVVRRLLQGRGDRLGVGAPDRGLEAPEGAPVGHGLRRRREGRAAGRRGGRAHLDREVPASTASACCASAARTTSGRWGTRALRAVHRDPHRPRRPGHEPARTARTAKIGVNAGNERFMELWNLVFIEFNRHDGRLARASCRRSTSTRAWASSASRRRAAGQAQSNYDTDLFAPIFARSRSSPARRYGGELATRRTSRSA